MPSIEVRKISKVFGRQNVRRALELVEKGTPKAEILERTGCTVGVVDADITVQDREIFVIMGLSGSGKSTLLRCLNRLIEPTSGEVRIDGEDIVTLSREQLRMVRRKKLAMVFQHFGLLPHRTVIQNVWYGLEIQNIDEKTRREKSEAALELVGLTPYADSMVQELSGGMQQRVGLARALATDAEILLMDEAFSALDPLIRTQMQDELLDLQAKMHKTIVFITHDLDEALKLGDRIAIMKDGKIVQIGTPEEILTKPTSDYVRAFVENVDRSRVISAGTVMQRAQPIIHPKDGAHQAVRRMRDRGMSTVFVTDAEWHLQGLVRIDDAVALIKQDRRDLSPILREVEQTTPAETPIIDLLALASASAVPIPVVDEQGVLKGIVTRAAILAGIAGEIE